MASTALSNVVVPEVFDRYTRQQTTLKSALLNSAVLVGASNFDALAASESTVVTLPHFNPFAWVESDLMNDDSAVKGGTAAVTAAAQVAQKDYRAKAWSAMELTSAVIGEDVPAYIANIAATYWTQDIQQNVLAKLKGIEVANVANNGGDMVVNVATDATGTATAAQSVTINTILDACQTMGDSADKLGVIVMHSQVFTNLMKLEPHAFQAPSETQPFTTYYRKRVVIDDTGLVVQGTNRKTFTTYILGQGAFAYGEAAFGRGTTVVYDDHSGNNAGEEKLITRKQLLIHPQGFTCAAAITSPAKSPSLAQYSAAGAFTRVFERKNVPIAILKTNA
ncbi:hypothetical protein [Sphingobium sp. KCTC 72723]|uniref:hypothetical protein n=1 Tax=Sphingobium sp. KCTC 72723 TaxID=2733867 RepID=UPI00165DE6F6|nr:hypothetical protein [Sphingobium sp. KCTC 72723]